MEVVAALKSMIAQLRSEAQSERFHAPLGRKVGVGESVDERVVVMDAPDEWAKSMGMWG